MLREPVARVYSSYRFLRSWEGEINDTNRGMVEASKRYALTDFLRVDAPQVRTVVRNQQTYSLATDWRATREGDGQRERAAALKNLDEFVLVGLQERADESMARLFRALHWAPPPRLAQ